jgi:hypothetical protein
MLAVTAALSAAACSMPRIPFVSDHHEVTVTASGRTYCTDGLRRDGSIVEFKDGMTGAWMSAAGTTTHELSAAEYRSCIAR